MKNITVDFIKKLPSGKIVIADATSNSMEPTIKKGDKITLQKVKFDQVMIDDIIAFSLASYDYIVVHRVRKNFKDSQGRIYMTTKGDNEFLEDSWIVSKDNFLGKVISSSSFY